MKIMKRKAVFLLCAIMLTVSPVYAEEATTEAIEETILEHSIEKYWL